MLHVSMARLAGRFPSSQPPSPGKSRCLWVAARASDTHVVIDVAKGCFQFSASRCILWNDSGNECYRDVSHESTSIFQTSILQQAILSASVMWQETNNTPFEKLESVTV